MKLIKLNEGGATKMAYTINEDCISCGVCEPTCPTDAISAGDGIYVIDEGACIDCGVCAPACPVDAIKA